MHEAWTTGKYTILVQLTEPQKRTSYITEIHALPLTLHISMHALDVKASTAVYNTPSTTEKYSVHRDLLSTPSNLKQQVKQVLVPIQRGMHVPHRCSHSAAAV